jgi:predicted HTH domain antitoxin
MYLELEIPNDCLTTDNSALISCEVKLSYALWLFKQARVTMSKAAQLAGLTLYDFMAACKLHQVSVIDTTEQELRHELLSSIARRSKLLA